MRAAFLLAAILGARYCALRYPCPKALSVYLWASLVENVGEIVTWNLYGETQWEYAACWYLCECLGLGAMLYLAWTNRTKQWHAGLGALLAVFVAASAYGSLEEPLHHYDWFAIGEGALLAFAGTVLVFSAAHWPLRSIYFSLGALWLAQCVFRLDFILNVTARAWLRANEYVPIVLLCLALGWIGYRIRAQGRLVEGKA